MKAVQLAVHGVPGRFTFGDVPDPRPAPDEVVVKVRACGLNRLDLWLEKGELPIRLELPRTPGGEVAGEIEELGGDVDEWRIGDRVAVQSNLFCGICEYCLRGDESVCLVGELLGVQRNGGFAEKVVVPARSLVKLPAEVSFEASASITLAGSTAMHMLTNRAEIRSSDWVLVLAGASGVGSIAIQIAKQFGAHVITTGSTEEKRAFALALGADHALDSTSEDWPSEVRRITQKRGVDLVVEHIGGTVLQKVFQCLARGGTVVTCGATESSEISLNIWPFFVKQQRLIGSYGRDRSDMETTLEWAATGRLKPIIYRSFPLAETSEAFTLLRSRKVLGKIVVIP